MIEEFLNCESEQVTFNEQGLIQFADEKRLYFFGIQGQVLNLSAAKMKLLAGKAEVRIKNYIKEPIKAGRLFKIKETQLETQVWSSGEEINIAGDCIEVQAQSSQILIEFDEYQDVQYFKNQSLCVLKSDKDLSLLRKMIKLARTDYYSGRPPEDLAMIFDKFELADIVETITREDIQMIPRPMYVDMMKRIEEKL